MKKDTFVITNRLQDVGSLSRQAHEAWLESLRTKDADKFVEVLRRGDDAWTESLHQLRLDGIDWLSASAGEREALLNFAQEVDDDQPIDFRPLERAYITSLAVKTLSHVVLLAMIATTGFIAGRFMAIA